MSYWYLATPYSKFEGGLDAAYIAACEQAAVLLRAGIVVFSPIAHSHGIAKHGHIDPLDHNVWLPADAPLMQAAHGLILCCLPGWQESYGMEEERKAFANAGKPILYMTPWVLPADLAPGHTDLMVSPEAIDTFLCAHPPGDMK